MVNCAVLCTAAVAAATAAATPLRANSQNPGFDFSGADISGNYHGGGPDLTKSAGP